VYVGAETPPQASPPHHYGVDFLFVMCVMKKNLFLPICSSLLVMADQRPSPKLPSSVKHQHVPIKRMRKKRSHQREPPHQAGECEKEVRR
jgi:hypothetical protein